MNMLFHGDLDELIELLISSIMIFIFTALSFNNFLLLSRVFYNPFLLSMRFSGSVPKVL
jgi:hypothetical protein